MLVQMNPARGPTCARLWFGIAVIVVLVVSVVVVVVALFGVVVIVGLVMSMTVVVVVSGVDVTFEVDKRAKHRRLYGSLDRRPWSRRRRRR